VSAWCESCGKLRRCTGFLFAAAQASLPNNKPLNSEIGRRNQMISLTSRVAAIAVALSGLPSLAFAQAPAWPTRNITLVLPFAAGSGTDTTTRIISKELGAALGVGMVIDNKAGANGSIAASYVARAAPDGYTLFVTTNTTHSANPYLLKTLSYDPIKDFTPIARTGDLPFMLVINPEIPANSVPELIALAKKEPGKYSYASGSSSAIVSGATFARLAGLDLLHVPYKSSPPALTDVIAGRVSMMFVDVLTGLPHVNGKVLKALAVTTKNRSALLPDLPSMDEAGVKGFDITSWQGYLGPAGLPKEIVARLNTEIQKIVNRPEIRKELGERGMEAFSGPTEEFEQFLKDQLVVWEKLIADAGIEKQ
jgi:putative tricarboxylic transport membrane protein